MQYDRIDKQTLEEAEVLAVSGQRAVTMNVQKKNANNWKVTDEKFIKRNLILIARGTVITTKCSPFTSELYGPAMIASANHPR